MDNPAPLLSPKLVKQIQRIAEVVRRRELAALVGSGISKISGLPGWSDLVEHMILAWKEWDQTAARHLSPDDYLSLVRTSFKSNLEVISYLRHRVNEEGPPHSFAELLFTALYTPRTRPSEVVTPEPVDIHRHLVALFHEHPRRIWTTNYDDLLEEAARQAGYSVSIVDPHRRRATVDLSIAHLHGFLAPRDRLGSHVDLKNVHVILAEDDYHAITADLTGWVNREFHRLFDEHSVLILGMSLKDPNVRRILSILGGSTAPIKPRHFAVMRRIPVKDTELSGTHGSGSQIPTDQDPNGLRNWYWSRYGLELIELEDYGQVLPFLLRLRYESFGQAAGDLWRDGARIGYEQIEPWRPDRQRTAKLYLKGAVDTLREDFAVDDPSEIVEIGMFLLKPDGQTLELTFRSTDVDTSPRGREFSADPDSPTGVAGRVFVSGDMVRVARDHPLHDYGLDIPESDSPKRYEGIISVPIVNWTAGGVPIGVIYVTTSTINGTLFALPPRSIADAGQRSLEDLYVWLSELAMSLLTSWGIGVDDANTIGQIDAIV